MDQTTDQRTKVENTSPPDVPRFRLGQRVRERQPQPRHGSSRETIESVVIAFVLAFLFRTFEAEAFVIPTGSMAPTLMGRHKEITCKQCGWTFTVGATEEMEHTAPLARCVCPNCRFVNDVQNEPAFKGDRILVLKALYDLPDSVPERLRNPHRWDVVVFKFPEEPQVNYIKRLVALPGEEPRIHYGNFFTRTDESAEFRIARKPPHKQKVLRMPVYDNNHQPKDLPESWARWTSDTAAGPGWKTSDGRRFETPPASNSGGDALSSSARLAYRHLSRSWDSTQDLTTPPPPQLITDFYGYNSGSIDGRYRYGDTDQSPHWVGDLTLSLQARVSEARGKLRLDLVEAGEHFICEFDFESGACRLYGPEWRSAAGQSAGDKSEFLLDEAHDVITRPGKYKIEFANVDDRLTVWVDGKLPFGDGYDYAGPRLGEAQVPTADDLQPAAIESRGASLTVSDLVLYRDIYYTHNASGSEYADFFSGDLEKTLSQWGLEHGSWEAIGRAPVTSFLPPGPLGPDDFLMCGDNSPRSKDGRLWDEGAQRWVSQLAAQRAEDEARRQLGFVGENLNEGQQKQVANLASDLLRSPDFTEAVTREIAQKPGGDLVNAAPHVVRRQLLIGKAFFVYWPHGVPFGPDWMQFDVSLRRFGTFRVPFYPNLARMNRIE